MDWYVVTQKKASGRTAWHGPIFEKKGYKS